MPEEEQREFRISGKDIKEKSKQIFSSGNAWKFIIKNEKEETLLTLPLIWTLIGAVIFPTIAIISFIILMLTNCLIVVGKK